MSSVSKRVAGVAQLLRMKPVASWGISAFMLGCALAYARVGTEIHFDNGVLALSLVILSQGIVSHGLNDVYDWLTGTDKESIGKGTGGSRVIPEGKLSVMETLLTALIGLVGVVAIGAYFVWEFGAPMVALILVALWSPVAYSVPPLKLGYRPFNELVVVLPALVGVVVGTDMVLTGSWSWAAIGIGWVHALFCISWFVVSRIPDYRPDKRVGKVTSVVYVGLDNASLLSAGYLALALAAVPLLFVTVTNAVVVTPIVWAGMMLELSFLDAYDPEDASATRLYMMHLTTLHAVWLSVMLLVWW